MINAPDIVDRLIYGNDLPSQMELECRHIMLPLLRDAADEILNLRAEVNRLLAIIYLNRDNIDGGYGTVKETKSG